MTSSEALQVFGDTISAKYFNGTDYVDIEYRYQFVGSISSVYSDTSFESVYEGASFLLYATPTIYPSSNPDYITFDIKPQYSIFNTTQIHTFIALNGADYALGSAYQSPSWDWIVNGSSLHAENSATYDGAKSYFYYSDYWTFVPFDFRAQNAFSAYSIRATFHGNSTYGGNSWLAIGIPYVDVDAEGEPGTGSLGSSGSGGSGGDINVSVDVDMSETNGLLGTLIDAVKGIGTFIIDGLQSLFVPKDGVIDNFYNTLLNLFYEVFAPYKDVHDLLDQLQEDLLSNSAMETVTFPQISVPGTDFSIGPYQVALKPAAGQMADFYATLRTMFNVLATILVVNMLITRIKAILVGEQVVEVEEIDDY